MLPHRSMTEETLSHWDRLSPVRDREWRLTKHMRMTVQYSCGCGYTVKGNGGEMPQVVQDAMNHASETGHSLTCTGIIRPSEKGVPQ